MNDAQSTVAGLKLQDCPGGGWNGMPAELERATVADCLAHGVCGCIYGDAVQHIERLRAKLKTIDAQSIATTEPNYVAVPARQELARALDVIARLPATPDQPKPEPWSRELVKEIAMDIGKDTVAYVEVIYPEAIKAASSTFKLSLRNHIYNQIMAAIETNDADEIRARLAESKKFRREWVAAYRKMRREDKP